MPISSFSDYTRRIHFLLVCIHCTHMLMVVDEDRRWGFYMAIHEMPQCSGGFWPYSETFITTPQPWQCSLFTQTQCKHQTHTTHYIAAAYKLLWLLRCFCNPKQKSSWTLSWADGKVSHEDVFYSLPPHHVQYHLLHFTPPTLQDIPGNRHILLSFLLPECSFDM